MAYCSKCGEKNKDRATFCNKCGMSLSGENEWRRRRDHDDDCEKECSGKEGSRFPWGIIFILIGLWVIWEWGIKNMDGMPEWVEDFQFWWVFPIFIGIAIMYLGFMTLSRDNKKKD
jgi:uncharacterized membrane protein YvbJ